DHTGGLVNVVQKLSVQNAIMTDATANTQTFQRLVTAIKNRKVKVLRAKANDRYTLGGASFTIKGPVKEYSDTNDMSIVLKLQFKNRSFLFTGDAPIASETDMLATGEDLSADVLKVGHHGSKTATSPSFLQAVSPRYGIISVGKDNKYGLPNLPVLDRLRAAGVQLYRTDEQGTIVMQTDGENMTVKTENAA
ncbi:ComEC/Rec2 family competence protein, partial [Ethanoligenens sp.]|uniref:ComEC/Rec2 family competence protein n=1 Tax=Ethanoligenens sp. TaxID=2099655 RepID=UPI0039E928F6